ncbi:hypothetical protein STFE110948_01645 [Streptobacillus felis]
MKEHKDLIIFITFLIVLNGLPLIFPIFKKIIYRFILLIIVIVLYLLIK